MEVMEVWPSDPTLERGFVKLAIYKKIILSNVIFHSIKDNDIEPFLATVFTIHFYFF